MKGHLNTMFKTFNTKFKVLDTISKDCGKIQKMLKRGNTQLVGAGLELELSHKQELAERPCGRGSADSVFASPAFSK